MRQPLPFVTSLVFAAAISAGCADRAPADDQPVAADRPPIEVAVSEVTTASISRRIELTGNLIPRRRAVIVSEVDGVIIALPKPNMPVAPTEEQLATLRSMGVDLSTDSLGLDIGDRVAEGAVLVQLARRDFELELETAMALSNKARADLDHLHAWKRSEVIAQLEAMHRQASAEVERSQTDLSRAESLQGKAAITQREYDRRAFDVQRAEAVLAHAAAELELAKAGPTPSEVAILQAVLDQANANVLVAEEDLRKTEIRAPYDCVVTDRYVGVGERVTALPRVEILEIVDETLVLAQVGVPERFIDSISIGDSANLRIEGIETEVVGIVVMINGKVDSATRTFRVRVATDNREGRFKVGQFARAYFNVSSSVGAMRVPLEALSYAGGTAEVFVYHDKGHVERRVVELGIRGEGFVAILAGLETGELVVTDDPSVLADGMTVRLRGEAGLQR